MLLDIQKVQITARCDWRDERYGFCNREGKYLVAGIACCGTHLTTIIKQQLDED